MAVKAIPEGYHAVTPYLIIKGAKQALEYYKKVFGAVELMRFDAPGGRIGHAEIKIGDSPVMLADENPEGGHVSPQTLGGTAVSLMVYVDDCDAVFDRAVQAGATVRQPLKDQFYGDRTGTIADPFGHVWTIGTHKEDVTLDEMKRRMSALQPA